MKHITRSHAAVPVVIGAAVLLALTAALAAAGIDGIEVVGGIDLYAKADPPGFEVGLLERPVHEEPPPPRLER